MSTGTAAPCPQPVPLPRPRLTQEEKDSVKHMNQMMLYSKCVTIRDAQILEKKQMMLETEDENRRQVRARPPSTLLGPVHSGVHERQPLPPAVCCHPVLARARPHLLAHAHSSIDPCPHTHTRTRTRCATAGPDDGA